MLTRDKLDLFPGGPIARTRRSLAGRATPPSGPLTLVAPAGRMGRDGFPEPGTRLPDDRLPHVQAT